MGQTGTCERIVASSRMFETNNGEEIDELFDLMVESDDEESDDDNEESDNEESDNDIELGDDIAPAKRV